MSVETGEPSGAAPETIAWVVNPSREAPQKRFAVLGAALMAGIAGFLVGGAMLAAVGFAIVLGSTAEFWLGARYGVGPGGGTAKVGLSVSAIEWGSVKRVILSGETVKLSPLEGEGRLDAFRGVTLRTLPENRDEVVAAVRGYCGEHARFLGD